MLSQKEYYDRLVECMWDHRKFKYITQKSLSEKTVIRKLSGEFELLFEIKVLCVKFSTPSYMENLELEVLEEEVVKLGTPTTNQ